VLAGGRFQLMTTPVFAGVAVFCSILVVWFGFETRNLCDKLSPDEYMQATLLAQQSMQRPCTVRRKTMEF
jgi:hypothetical protein